VVFASCRIKRFMWLKPENVECTRPLAQRGKAGEFAFVTIHAKSERQSRRAVSAAETVDRLFGEQQIVAAIDRFDRPIRETTVAVIDGVPTAVGSHQQRIVPAAIE
jgi:hypothetical protein